MKTSADWRNPVRRLYLRILYQGQDLPLSLPLALLDTVPHIWVIRVSLDGYLYALNADGTQRWKVNLRDWVISSPAVGAALGISLCIAARKILDEMATFADVGVSEKE